MRKPQSFETYYLRNIAIAEACGCAEALARYHAIDRARRDEAAARPRLAWWRKVKLWRRR